MFGVGALGGQLLGGIGGRYLYTMHPRYPSLLSGSMAMIGCIPIWVLVNSASSSSSSSSSWWEFTVLISILAGLSAGVTGPIVKATLQNVTLPTSRGQAFAIFNTFDDFGRGLGPVFVAQLILRFKSRQMAFNVGILGWVACGLLNLATYWTVAQDEDRVQSILAASLEAQENQLFVYDTV
mmetsp:Transcript_21732/g.50148  ORF Transcript_21732/g.50148 Transcript_21732/m.50148 type:complete len:181 (-) Transcript_21732:1259-1801(-)